MQSLAVFTPAAPKDSPVPESKINALDILSVPLVLGLHRRGVTPCIAIWSPDFPPLKEQRSPVKPRDYISPYTYKSHALSNKSTI